MSLTQFLPEDCLDTTILTNDDGGMPVVGGFLYKLSVRKTVLGFPNAGRHVKNWKRRWFVLFSNGDLVYYRHRSELNPDDPIDGEERKTLELRGKLRLNKNAVCVAHFYYEDAFCMSIQCENSSGEMEELIARADNQSEMDIFINSCNKIIGEKIQNLPVKDDENLSDLASYVKRRLSLKHSLSADEDEMGLDGNSQSDGSGSRRNSKTEYPAVGIPVPKLSIVILVVGTRGDVSPFVEMGKKLKADFGHTVRIATHALYRDKVINAGLLFYPLGGDPIKLSGYMVKTQGALLPRITDVKDIQKHVEDVPEKVRMLEEICNSTWPACTATDPEDPSASKFVADVIISNPVTYGHIHCAEALAIPIHMFFPQPWTPTKAFPHVLSSMDFGKVWSWDNYLSYYFVDEFMWLGTMNFVNKFREDVLQLPMMRRGELGGHRLNTLKIPFSYMFSKYLVPKPKDWPAHTDIVGNFFNPITSDFDDDSLKAFLAENLDEPPIFIGFGSMVIAEPKKLANMIRAASEKTNTRVILQSSWSSLAFDEDKGDSSSKESKPNLIYSLGNCPHDWLFGHCRGVVHHGGAGTVAAGLRAGKPSFICPFFGDQFFWGQVVYRAGVGPAPCPAADLTADVLADAFVKMKSVQMREKAEEISRQFENEDGLDEGIRSFHKQLPIEDMVCDVSLFLPEAHREDRGRRTTQVASKWCSICSLKMSKLVDEVVHAEGSGKEHHIRHDYRPVDWGCSEGPENVLSGAIQGVAGFGQECLSALGGLVVEPIKGVANNGIRGGVDGALTGLKGLVVRPLRGGLILLDKSSAGVRAHWEKKEDNRNRRYVFFDKVHKIGVGIGNYLSGNKEDLGLLGGGKIDVESDTVGEGFEDVRVTVVEGSKNDGSRKLSASEKRSIYEAFEIALECKKVFDRIEKAKANGVVIEGKLGLTSKDDKNGNKDKNDLARTLSEAIYKSGNSVSSIISSGIGQQNRGDLFSYPGANYKGQQEATIIEGNETVEEGDHVEDKRRAFSEEEELVFHEKIQNVLDSWFGVAAGKSTFASFATRFLFDYNA